MANELRNGCIFKRDTVLAKGLKSDMNTKSYIDLFYIFNKTEMFRNIFFCQYILSELFCSPEAIFFKILCFKNQFSGFRMSF